MTATTSTASDRASWQHASGRAALATELHGVVDGVAVGARLGNENTALRTELRAHWDGVTLGACSGGLRRRGCGVTVRGVTVRGHRLAAADGVVIAEDVLDDDR